MAHRLHHHVVHTRPFLTPFLLTIAVLLTIGTAFATVIGDQVYLKARHRAGVPLHQEPRGTHDVQRVPDGTRATVIELAQDGRWLKLSLPDGRTGWVTSSYLSDRTPGPSTAPSPTGTTPQRREEGLAERVADGDTLTVITATHTKLRIRMFGMLSVDVSLGEVGKIVPPASPLSTVPPLARPALVLDLASRQPMEANGHRGQSRRMVLSAVWPALDTGAALMKYG